MIIERLMDYYKRLEMPDAFVLEKVLSSTQSPVWPKMTSAVQGPHTQVYRMFIVQCVLSVEVWLVIELWPSASVFRLMDSENFQQWLFIIFFSRRGVTFVVNGDALFTLIGNNNFF